jgi:hypothetical protein
VGRGWSTASPQDPIDGVSFAYTFDKPDAPGRLKTQYFEIIGSRVIYHDGWMASAFGPTNPVGPGLPPGIKDWTLTRTNGSSIASTMTGPRRTTWPPTCRTSSRRWKETFAIEAARNSVYPVGGGLWIVSLHPELRIPTPTADGTSRATSPACPTSAPPPSAARDDCAGDEIDENPQD